MKKNEMLNIPCPFCGQDVELVDSKKVFRKSYGLIYLCSGFPACGARVGVHRNTQEPLGTLADERTRRWRIKAHEMFNPLSANNRELRRQSYRWLQQAMGKSKSEAHIGQFDVDDCKKLVNLLATPGKRLSVIQTLGNL